MSTEPDVVLEIVVVKGNDLLLVTSSVNVNTDDKDDDLLTDPDCVGDDDAVAASVNVWVLLIEVGSLSEVDGDAD